MLKCTLDFALKSYVIEIFKHLVTKSYVDWRRPTPYSMTRALSLSLSLLSLSLSLSLSIYLSLSFFSFFSLSFLSLSSLGYTYQSVFLFLPCSCIFVSFCVAVSFLHQHLFTIFLKIISLSILLSLSRASKQYLPIGMYNNVWIFV